MHNANFYEELKNKMTFHDMLYNEYVDFKLGTPLDEENFNILQGNIVWLRQQQRRNVHERACQNDSYFAD